MKGDPWVSFHKPVGMHEREPWFPFIKKSAGAPHSPGALRTTLEND